jgi:hypothetical protein
VGLAKAEESNLRAVLPAGFSIPEFNGFDYAAVAREIDGASLAAGRNAIANDEFFVRAVMEVHDYFFEENFTTLDTQLDGAETAVVFANVNVVVILAPVYVGVAEIIPALRLRADGGKCKSKQKSNRSKSDSFEHGSSAVFP